MTRKTITQIQQHKNGDPLVVLTAYTARYAELLDPHTDILLVGDSLGMVLYGLDSTLPVTLNMMIAHGAAVVRGSKTSLVVVDMPFASYQASKEQAYKNAARVIQHTGCTAIKLEGGAEMAETITYLTQRAIPVIGHVALMPQHVHTLGGYHYQGKNKEERTRILSDAKAVQEAGASAIVLEGIETTLAQEITQTLSIPTIGIGAAPECDGQVLVTEDMLGLFEKNAKFVKRYAQIAGEIESAVKNYASEVRARSFPTKEHCYTNKE